MAEAWYNALANEAANGVSATEAVGAVLGGPAGAAMAGASAAARMAAAAGGGGSWSFDPEEIDAVIKEWKALLDELEGDQQSFLSITNSNYAPSGDRPSGHFMSALNDGVRALEESNMSMRDYVAGFIEKLERAKESIGESDQSKAGVLGKAESREV
ncbi:hypothetical protein ABT332_18395 [Saccharomonospora azurea]|uniref:hypothetical protein n=1 Tax=Saccharomonospora azurea TaxID=40988 RepID=UPI003331256B